MKNVYIKENLEIVGFEKRKVGDYFDLIRA